MPAKSSWCSRINTIVRELERGKRPFVDRAAVELLLGVGRRRAQQILAPCVTSHIGANGLADRRDLIAHLQNLAGSDLGRSEALRRLRVAQTLTTLHAERLEGLQLLVRANVAIEQQALEHLPAGISVEPGRITVTFGHPREALEKLLALAMAIRNDLDRFEKQAAKPEA